MNKRDLGEIHRIGMEALLNALGPDDSERFIEHCRTEIRDYTKERAAIIGSPTVEEIVERVRTREGSDPSRGAAESTLTTRA